MFTMVRVGILGATGYAGIELVRILPKFSVKKSHFLLFLSPAPEKWTYSNDNHRYKTLKNSKNHFTRALPSQTINIPSTTLTMIYISITIQWRCCNSKKLSFAKDEKVVKPPQKPVISNALIAGVIACVRSAIPNRIPIIKLPTIFTTKVPNGKPPTTNKWHNRPVAYRRQVPTKPPRPAKNIIFIIYISFSQIYEILFQIQCHTSFLLFRCEFAPLHHGTFFARQQPNLNLFYYAFNTKRI